MLGVDVGGSGIKSALVDVTTGSLLTERARESTPEPATPEAVAGLVDEMVARYDYTGPVGLGFPAVIRRGIVETANNIDKGWVGKEIGEVFSEIAGRGATFINDADAAAVAEARFGAAAGVAGLVLTITFGTGIGSGMLVDGRLVPNLELGQLELEGHSPAEQHFSARVRRREDLDWEQWGSRASRYLTHVDSVFNPDLMVIGGGLVKHWDLFAHHIDQRLPVVAASMGNNAGLIGAAILAAG